MRNLLDNLMIYYNIEYTFTYIYIYYIYLPRQYSKPDIFQAPWLLITIDSGLETREVVY